MCWRCERLPDLCNRERRPRLARVVDEGMVEGYCPFLPRYSYSSSDHPRPLCRPPCVWIAHTRHSSSLHIFTTAERIYRIRIYYLVVARCCCRRMLLQRDAPGRSASHTLQIVSASHRNLKDFPLSRTLRSHSSVPTVNLSPGHLQLAAQVPSQWTRSQQTLKQTRLALRKIVWRALLQDTFNMRQELGREGDVGESAEGGNTTSYGIPLERLGRLNDATYADWETFCGAVRTKSHPRHRNLPPAPSTWLERRIEVFHVLRCILGPVVETFILLDRLAWMSEELEVRHICFCKRAQCAYFRAGITV